MTDAEHSSVDARSFLLAAASFVIVVAGIRAAASLVVPFLSAAFIAIICGPAVHRLRQRGVPTAVALLIVIALVALVFVFILGLLMTSIDDFISRAGDYVTELNALKLQFEEWLKTKDISVSQHVSELVDWKSIVRPFVNILSGIRSLVGNAFLVLLTVVFILLEASDFPRKLIALYGGSREGLERAELVRQSVMHYISIKTCISLATGMLISLSMTALGVPYAFLWGLLAFFFNFVPNIGSIIAAVPAVLIALVDQGPTTAIYTTLVYLVVNVVIGNFVEPRLMGRGLGLSTLVVFVSLVFWGWALGVMGMLLSVPLTMVTKIVLEASPETRGIAILLSSAPSADGRS